MSDLGIGGGDTSGESGGGGQTPPPGPPAGGGDRFRGRVRFTTDTNGMPYAHRPDELLTHDDHTNNALRVLTDRFGAGSADADARVGPHRQVRISAGVSDAVNELRHAGIPAQPNHVYFSHAAGLPGTHGSHPTANPVYASPVYASPVYASPVYASPVYASPVYASPVYASPVYASPVYASGVGMIQHSTAQPAVPGPETDRLGAQMALIPAPDAPTVYVLDTGLAAKHPHYIPAALSGSPSISAPPHNQADPTDTLGTRVLAPAAGHSTFIAGLIEGVAGGTRVEVHEVLAGEGDGDEFRIAQAIDALSPSHPHRAILNLSFGGHVLDHPFVLARALNRFMAAGGVVVASAGNDASARPTYPAALPGVIGVGAIGPSGPAPFSNYGPWVRACAPGVDLISAFFKGWDDASGADYEGWAIWSGTSFSAPLVAGSVSRLLLTRRHQSARAAAAELIDSPWLMRIPNLGTVVNAA